MGGLLQAISFGLAPVKVITGKLTRADGSPVGGVAVSVRLSAQAVVASTQEVAPTRIGTTTASDGTWTISLQANADLTPTTTSYTFDLGEDFEVVAIVPQTAGPFKLEDIMVAPAVGTAWDAALMHLAGTEYATGVKVFGTNVEIKGPGPWIDPLAFTGTDPTGGTVSTAGLQAALSAVPTITGADVLLAPGPTGAALYVIDAALVYKAGTRFRGAGWAMGGAVTIKVKDGTNLTGPGGITGILVPSAWNTNQTLCDGPVLIENLKLDGNRANNPSGQVCGVVLYNFWSHIRDNYIANTNKYGVLLTDTSRDGSTHLANTASENRVYGNHFSNTGDDSIRQVLNNGAFGTNLDGFCDDNTIDSPLGSAIRFDAAAGWSVRRNHGYGVKKHFIYAPKCFATVIADNDTDDFGLEATAATTYYGIYTTSVPGAKPTRGGHVHDNSLDCTEAGGTAVYHYYWADDVGVTGVAHLNVHDNTGRYSGAGASAGFLLTLNASAATWIYEERGNVGLNLLNAQRVLISGTGQVRRRPPIPSSKPASGNFLTQPFNSVGTIQFTSLSSMVLVPVDVNTEQTFTGIWLNLSVVGTGAGQVARLGLYGDDGTFSAPAGAPIEDLGTIDTLATTGDKGLNFASPRLLLPARYWLAIVIQVALTVGPTFTSSNGGAAIALAQSTLATTGSGRSWGMSSVSGAMPTLSSLFSTSTAPMLGLKAQ